MDAYPVMLIIGTNHPHLVWQLWFVTVIQCTSTVQFGLNEGVPFPFGFANGGFLGDGDVDHPSLFYHRRQ